MITKVLFIYKDEILLKKFTINYTLNKMFYYPGSILYILRIGMELNYYLVLVNNQVYLGTEKLPRVLNTDLQMAILNTLGNEEIHFSSIYITSIKGIINFSKNDDRCIVLSSNMLMDCPFYTNKLDINIPITTILSYSWKRIYKLLKFCFNECSYKRRSKETDIQIFIKIEGKGISYIYTGLGFFDHMIDQICLHASIDIGLIIKGDIHIDEHHTIEDTAIAIGIALSKTLKDKRGIARYGFLLPMDDILAQVVIDLGGRNNFIWKVFFEREKIGDVPTEMFAHFFKSFSDITCCNLHIEAEGNNEHHKIEAIFKAFACALKMATSRNYHNNKLPSTKEIL